MSAPSNPIRIAIVNDYDIVVNGLAKMLEPYSDRVEVVAIEAGGTPGGTADIALFDTFASRRNALRRIQLMSANTDINRVVLYTWDFPPAFAGDVSKHDVDGVILKSESGSSLVSALERVHRGETVGTDDVIGHGAVRQLTEREREVLALLAQGRTNRQIADELYLSLDTVKTHVRKVFRKLGVENRTQAALQASDFGLAMN